MASGNRANDNSRKNKSGYTMAPVSDTEVDAAMLWRIELRHEEVDVPFGGENFQLGYFLCLSS